ncbi:MAG: FxsA family protein [Paracoccaceae bacterium]|nr:FxsA family protein [Paracoccaceae bacterium]
MPLFLVLVAVPIIEIALFIEVGGWLGLWPTLAIVILTALIGTVLLRAQGLAAVGDLQRRLQMGEDPSPTIAHGAMILVAGLLLLTPGFFTDGVGFLLLTPPVRNALIGYLKKRITLVQTSVHGGFSAQGDRNRGDRNRGAGGPGTVDGEFEVVDPQPAGQDGDASGWSRPPKIE